MTKTKTCNAGFTLLELLVAIAIFTVVGGVALGLVAKNVPLYNRQQGTVALNVGLRSAMAQIELDMVNGGTGYYVGATIPTWPIGVTLIKAPATSCYDSTTKTYGAGCFDTLNIIAVDPSTQPAHPAPAGASCPSTDDSSILFAEPPPGMTADEYAEYYKEGDQLLLVKVDGSQMTTVVLTDDADTSGSKVQLQHNPTGDNGTNPYDDFGIATYPNNKLGTEFCDDDWILKLSPVTYEVDTSVAANPKLVRKQGGNEGVVAEQIIGFKLGASIWNNSNGSDQYYFDPAEYPNADGSGTGLDPYNFTLVRSVRVSLIGRTTPITDPTYTFRNTFDGGAYQIRAVSVVVNPRNLSMKD
jgi:prepilin-type N-terminal cleavage/methylation domain-containing protein